MRTFIKNDYLCNHERTNTTCLHSKKRKDMLGTIVNTCTILAGGMFGALVKSGIGEKYKSALFNGLGLCCLVLGMNASIPNLAKSEYRTEHSRWSVDHQLRFRHPWNKRLQNSQLPPQSSSSCVVLYAQEFIVFLSQFLQIRCKDTE